MRLTWALLSVLGGLAGASSPHTRELLQGDPKALELLSAVESQEASFRADAAKEPSARAQGEPKASPVASVGVGPHELIKEPLVKAHLDFAEYVYLKSKLPDDARVSIALRSYRRVQQIDPENAQARGRLQTIANVYEAWGKPFPK